MHLYNYYKIINNADYYTEIMRQENESPDTTEWSNNII